MLYKFILDLTEIYILYKFMLDFNKSNSTVFPPECASFTSRSDVSNYLEKQLWYREAMAILKLHLEWPPSPTASNFSFKDYFSYRLSSCLLSGTTGNLGYCAQIFGPFLPPFLASIFLLSRARSSFPQTR